MRDSQARDSDGVISLGLNVCLHLSCRQVRTFQVRKTVNVFGSSTMSILVPRATQIGCSPSTIPNPRLLRTSNKRPTPYTLKTWLETGWPLPEKSQTGHQAFDLSKPSNTVVRETKTKIKDSPLYQRCISRHIVVDAPPICVYVGWYDEYKDVGLISSVQFSNDSKYIATGGYTRIQLFEWKSHSKVATFWAMDAGISRDAL